jgi:hypothetical protein
MASHSVDSEGQLRILGDELRSLGMVVVRRDDGLEVRLSTFETVRVRIEDSALQCEARFGAVSRTRARWTVSILSAVLVPYVFLTSGITPSTVSIGFLIVLAAVSQGIRYTVTESIISRIQMAWLNLRRVSSTSTPRETPNLRSGAFTPDAAAHERNYSDERITRSE